MLYNANEELQLAALISVLYKCLEPLRMLALQKVMLTCQKETENKVSFIMFNFKRRISRLYRHRTA